MVSPCSRKALMTPHLAASTAVVPHATVVPDARINEPVHPASNTIYNLMALG